MKKLIFGIAIGLVFGMVISFSYATMSSSRMDREFDKFTTDGSGNTAVLVTIVQ